MLDGHKYRELTDGDKSFIASNYKILTVAKIKKHLDSNYFEVLEYIKSLPRKTKHQSIVSNVKKLNRPPAVYSNTQTYS